MSGPIACIMSEACSTLQRMLVEQVCGYGCVGVGVGVGVFVFELCGDSWRTAAEVVGAGLF